MSFVVVFSEEEEIICICTYKKGKIKKYKVSIRSFGLYSFKSRKNENFHGIVTGFAPLPALLLPKTGK